ncbi:MAG TPA: hypothetical protein VFF06_06765 [Polyangia bacterium]|nr:hypothetical protein [Polyangia bacterium]
MSELIHEHSSRVFDRLGRAFVARIFAAPDQRGVWSGWIEFHALDGGPLLRTGTETTQPNRDSVAYWASGLEPIYLEGAFERARAAAPASSAWRKQPTM